MALALLLVASGFPALADAAEEVLYPGRIAFQGAPFPDFTDMEIYKDAVKKALNTRSLTRKANGDWDFHFVAFLNRRKARRAAKVNLAFYRNRQLVDFVEYGVDPQGKVLLAKAALQKARGFKPGDKVQAKVTVVRRAGKREIEIVLASTKRHFILE
jgi:hypothetical protein